MRYCYDWQMDSDADRWLNENCFIDEQTRSTRRGEEKRQHKQSENLQLAEKNKDASMGW